jgi:5-methylcytosine-specific restriction protein A
MPRKVYGTGWKKVRLMVLERDGWLCRVRGPNCLGGATEVDHIVPVVVGGAWHDPSNLRASCGPCNKGRNRQVIIIDQGGPGSPPPHSDQHRRRPPPDGPPPSRSW